jgi:hypothetical protein
VAFLTAALEREARSGIEPGAAVMPPQIGSPDPMTQTFSNLTDDALAVFAFAAYHQLASGQTVRSIAQRDGAGHKASDTAVAELREQGLIEADCDEIRFTQQGEDALQRMIETIKRS